MCSKQGNGADAMEKVRAGQFDLAILDVGLPDTDGRELCKRMRKAGLQVACDHADGA
jgi:DNA-binding response OmpR family regulator